MYFSLVYCTSGPTSSLKRGLAVRDTVTLNMDSSLARVGHNLTIIWCRISRCRNILSRYLRRPRQPSQQVRVAVLISQQRTQRNKTCVRMLFTQKHIILIHVKHRVSI